MNEKLKKVFTIIGSFLLGIVTFLLGGLLRNKRTRVDEARDDLKRAEDTNNSIRETVESVEHTVDNIKQSNNECEQIIRDIRKRGKKKQS